MKFRVESLYDIDAQPVVLATRLGTTEFSLARSAEPRLGGIRIRNFAEEVRRFPFETERRISTFSLSYWTTAAIKKGFRSARL